MDLSTFKATSKLAASRNILKLKKHMPTVLMTAGLAGMVTSTVLTAKATLKLESVMDAHDERMAEIKAFETAVEKGEVDLDNEFSQEDIKKVVVLQHIKTAVSLGRLYWLPVGLSAVSVAAIIGGHVQLTKRNAALAATVTSLQVAFNKYRQRVIDEFGADKERELRYKISQETVVDPETGESTETFHIDTTASVYAKIFDESNPEWTDRVDYNMTFLRAQQNYMNDLLNKRGHVFLNEAYDALNFPRTKQGQLVGWVKGNGDDFIDFGILGGSNGKEVVFYDNDSGNLDFMVLDFNVDGVVYDLI